MHKTDGRFKAIVRGPEEIERGISGRGYYTKDLLDEQQKMVDNYHELRKEGKDNEAMRVAGNLTLSILETYGGTKECHIKTIFPPNVNIQINIEELSK